MFFPRFSASAAIVLTAFAVLPTLTGCKWSLSRFPAPTFSIMVSMRDGVRLATDVYLPTGAGPWPVVLVRTPYKRDGVMRDSPLLPLGYAFVVQNTRGRFDSEGTDRAFRSDGWGLLKDGYDACAWIVNQPWCNGRIGTLGGSAAGITQCLLGRDRPPGLMCQVISFAPGDFCTDWAYPGGVQGGAWLEWLRQQGLTWLSGEAAEHMPRDAWWDRYDFISAAPEMIVPALHITGWFDFWTDGTIRRFQAWQERGSPSAAGKQRLLIGPWGHGIESHGVGDYRLEDNGKVYCDCQIRRFLDYWLKGEQNGIESEPPIHYFEVHPPINRQAGRWRATSRFPECETKTYYLRQAGVLTLEPPLESECVEFEYDPKRPWRTRNGVCHIYDGPREVSQEMKACAHLFFQTEPMQEPIVLVGPVGVSVYAEADAPSNDLMGMLMDIWPDGRRFMMVNGIQRIKWTADAQVPLPISEANSEISFIIGWTGYVVPKGHRIGLAISGGNWRQYERNPQNGKLFYVDGEAQPTRIRVHIGGSKASRLLLPVCTY